MSLFAQVWGLSELEAARVLGYSRPELTHWPADVVPRDRTETMADLEAATELLIRYVEIGRIPVVVRRPAADLDGRSLLELVVAGDARGTVLACRRMFDFSNVQG